jgi:hypothetical protein
MKYFGLNLVVGNPEKRMQFSLFIRDMFAKYTSDINLCITQYICVTQCFKIHRQYSRQGF